MSTLVPTNMYSPLTGIQVPPRRVPSPPSINIPSPPHLPVRNPKSSPPAWVSEIMTRLRGLDQQLEQIYGLLQNQQGGPQPMTEEFRRQVISDRRTAAAVTGRPLDGPSLLSHWSSLVHNDDAENNIKEEEDDDPRDYSALEALAAELFKLDTGSNDEGPDSVLDSDSETASSLN
jgi:hypothetical protein